MRPVTDTCYSVVDTALNIVPIDFAWTTVNFSDVDGAYYYEGCGRIAGDFLTIEAEHDAMGLHVLAINANNDVVIEHQRAPHDVDRENAADVHDWAYEALDIVCRAAIEDMACLATNVDPVNEPTAFTPPLF